jgi:hypothetical protein
MRALRIFAVLVSVGVCSQSSIAEEQNSDAAVQAALKWLADHQNRNGSWSWGHTPGDACSDYAYPGTKKSKMGATGMALLPFLGAGYTHWDGKYRETVRKGLKFLVGNMIVANNAGRMFEADGQAHEHMYCHGIATLALSEAFGMTADKTLQQPAQLAVNYIVKAQHPTGGGWLYTPRAGGNTSVTGWQVMALKSGIVSYLSVPKKVKPLANKYFEFVQWSAPDDGQGLGAFFGYRKALDRPNASAMTAIGIMCRRYLGASRDDPGLRKGMEALAAAGPSLKGNFYYNYYATHALASCDAPRGKLWRAWSPAIRKHLLNSQVRNGDDAGTWYLAGGGHGARAGGRIYCTAIAAITLQILHTRWPQITIEAADDFPLE